MSRAPRTCAEKLPGNRNCPSKATCGNRCEEHARAYEARRGTRQQRGYDAGHVAARAAAEPEVAAGRVRCWRCGEPIEPGQEWDLGHDDGGRLAGPEHRSACNRRAAALKGHGLEWTPRAPAAPPGAELTRRRADSQARAEAAAERRRARLGMEKPGQPE